MIILDVKIEDNKIDIIQDISTYDLQTILGINIINKYGEDSFEEFLRLLFPFII